MIARPRNGTAAALLVGALASASPSLAQEYGADFARFMGAGEDRLEYSASAMPAAPGAPGAVKQEARGSAVVSRGEKDAWTVSARAGELALSRSPRLPDGGPEVPSKLWDLSGGLSYERELGERRRWGASAGVGSASDEPFRGMRETSVLATARYQIPSGERNAWIFLLNYSNNRPFLNNVPLPGFAYLIRGADDRFFALLGFPFIVVRAKPDADTALTFSFFGGASYAGEIARRVRGPLSLYVRGERVPQQWLRAGRASATDRLVFDFKDLRVGARAPLGSGLSADVSAGRAFDRSFYEGRDAGGFRGDRTALADCWLVQAKLAWRWGAPDRRRE